MCCNRRLLNQTTPENLQRDIGSYTVDPATRYPNLNRSSVNVWQVKHLIDTDDKQLLEQTFMDTNIISISQVDTPSRRKRRSGGKFTHTHTHFTLLPSMIFFYFRFCTIKHCTLALDLCPIACI